MWKKSKDTKGKMKLLLLRVMQTTEVKSGDDAPLRLPEGRAVYPYDWQKLDAQ